ncbi:MAG TPA: riboflavin kinase [Ktedonobacterales bacterium]|nr:riboflavin kinase [Ktedonobacterales bacterium]
MTDIARIHYLIQRGALTGPVASGPIALAISDFDGAHTGHAALARRAAALAEGSAARPVALLPWPSPAGGDNTPAPRLTTLEERIERLRAWSIFTDIVIVPAPSAPLAASDALGEIRRLGEIHAIVREAAPVGAARALFPPETSALSAAEGIASEALGELDGGDLPGADGSDEPPGPLGARIGALIQAGRMDAATAALGYAYTVSGEVVSGDRRGRLLGYPTANLRPDPAKIIPANGIYAARVRLPGEDAPRHPAVVSIGVRPTFGEGNHRQIEAHLLDATFDLYGASIAIAFVTWLRSELRFDSVEALIARMDMDSEQSRRLLGVK